MLILNEHQIKTIISEIVKKKLTNNFVNEIDAKNVSKQMEYKSPKPDPFKMRKLTHVNMHAPGLMGENDDLDEYRGDQRIPFEGEYGKKANYDHFIDWLEHIGRYGNISGSGNANKLYVNAIEKGFEIFNAHSYTHKEIIEDFVDIYPQEEYPEYYFYEKQPTQLSQISQMDFTDEGLKIYNEFSYEEYYERLNVDLKINNRNLGLIYRAINIPELKNVDYQNIHKQDYFEELNKLYSGTGIFWSYAEDGAFPYGSNQGDTVTMYGLISPDDIDWPMTCYLGANGFNEQEIRTKENVPIEIYQIITDDGKRLPLKKSIIVTSGKSQ
jgi:hypothetical protein